MTSRGFAISFFIVIIFILSFSVSLNSLLSPKSIEILSLEILSGSSFDLFQLFNFSRLSYLGNLVIQLSMFLSILLLVGYCFLYQSTKAFFGQGVFSFKSLIFISLSYMAIILIYKEVQDLSYFFFSIILFEGILVLILKAKIRLNETNFVFDNFRKTVLKMASFLPLVLIVEKDDFEERFSKIFSSSTNYSFYEVIKKSKQTIGILDVSEGSSPLVFNLLYYSYKNSFDYRINYTSTKNLPVAYFDVGHILKWPVDKGIVILENYDIDFLEEIDKVNQGQSKDWAVYYTNENNVILLKGINLDAVNSANRFGDRNSKFNSQKFKVEKISFFKSSISNRENKLIQYLDKFGSYSPEVNHLGCYGRLIRFKSKMLNSDTRNVSISKISKVENICRKAVLLNENNFYLINRFADFILNMGDMKLAKYLVNEFIRRNGKIYRARLLMARVYSKSHLDSDLNTSLNLYLELLDESPRFVEIYYEVFNLLKKLKNWTLAKEILLRGSKLTGDRGLYRLLEEI